MRYTSRLTDSRTICKHHVHFHFRLEVLMREYLSKTSSKQLTKEVFSHQSINQTITQSINWSTNQIIRPPAARTRCFSVVTGLTLLWDKRRWNWKKIEINYQFYTDFKLWRCFVSDPWTFFWNFWMERGRVRLAMGDHLFKVPLKKSLFLLLFLLFPFCYFPILLPSPSPSFPCLFSIFSGSLSLCTFYRCFPSTFLFPQPLFLWSLSCFNFTFLLSANWWKPSMTFNDWGLRLVLVMLYLSLCDPDPDL